jgi:hypothetical protein
MPERLGLDSSPRIRMVRWIVVSGGNDISSLSDDEPISSLRVLRRAGFGEGISDQREYRQGEYTVNRQPVLTDAEAHLPIRFTTSIQSGFIRQSGLHSFVLMILGRQI